uniref:F-box associated domain-containing protein n=1 Tax=Leersia perrieri TaxID=77586 RepID=A0A0D9X073_9ORYZ
MQEQNPHQFLALLVPCGDVETTFKVIVRAHSVSKLVVFVFSSDSGQWSIGASTSWGALSLTLPPSPHNYMLQCGSYCAYGCFFWKLNYKSKLLMLDLSKMKFSTVDLPSDHARKNVDVVEAGEGRLGILVSDIGYATDNSTPVYFIRQNKGHGVQEWQMESIVENMAQLSVNCDYSTIGVVEGFLLLYCVQKPLAPVPSIPYFSLDVRTMNLERVSQDFRTYWISPYEIFLRIGSPTDLVRTSAACVSFCRLIIDPYFLRRFRTAHPPLLLGFLHLDGFEPVQPPHPSAPAAPATAQAADFSFGFLPPEGRPRRAFTTRWLRCYCFRRPHLHGSRGVRPLVPAVRAAPAHTRFTSRLCATRIGNHQPFRLLPCPASKLVVFVFSSDSGQWIIGACTRWDALISSPDDVMPVCYRNFAYGCIFWKLDKRNMLLMLDLSRMEFSTVNLPSDHEEKNVVVWLSRVH